MARQLTLAALEQLRKNPIIIPELPEYDAAETIVDPTIAPRVRRKHAADTDLVADEVFERWLARDLSRTATIQTTQIAPTRSFAQALLDFFRWLRL